MGHSESPIQASVRASAKRTLVAPRWAKEDSMEIRSSDVVARASAERLRSLAQRCRDLSEMTALPEMTRELESVARALEDEAMLVGRD
jgi:hypothetical protein